MALTLHSFAGDFRAFKALVAAQYNGVAINQVTFTVGKDDQTADFKAKSPTGTVPLLDTPAGSIFESNAIARYVARVRRDTGLNGNSFFESAQVDAWVDWSSHELELPASMWVYPVLGFVEFKQAVYEKAVEDMHKALAVLERQLLSRTYLVGEAVTLADIVVASALFYPFKLVLGSAAQSRYTSVTRWFTTCVNQAAFKAVMGEVVLAETEMAANGQSGTAAMPKAAAPAAADAAPKVEKKKEEKPKEAAKPKEAKKKDEDDMGEEDDIPREAPKADPFAHLPKSSFNLDEWKRTYSNSRGDYYKSMDWFWANLDKEGWSLWLQKYKYNHENQRDFMTSNLVGGFIQRSDEVRRFGFGMMHVFNAKAPYEVEGVWLFRGQDTKAMLDCNPDAEYYDFIKLDADNEEHRKMIADYWCAPESVNGKEIYDSKVFK